MPRALAIAAAAVLSLAGQAHAQPYGGGTSPPPGAYWSTCQNVSIYGRGRDAVISAQCRDDRGDLRSTSLRFAGCDAVENRGGALVCVGSPPALGYGRPPFEDRRGGIILFSEPGFQGGRFETRREITNLPRQFNDRAMSLRIDGRAAWQVCADSDFRGRCVILDRDVADLRDLGLGEAVSSMRKVGR